MLLMYTIEKQIMTKRFHLHDIDHVSDIFRLFRNGNQSL